MEIYNDSVYDLLKPINKLSDPLTITEVMREFRINNAEEKPVSTLEEVMSYVHIGENNRQYASTVMNHQSSRSHTIFRIKIKCIYLDSQFGKKVIESKMVSRNRPNPFLRTSSTSPGVRRCPSMTEGRHQSPRTG